MKSYIANRVSFLTNIFWIAIGTVLLFLSQSYYRGGAKVGGVVLAALAVVALGTGFLL